MSIVKARNKIGQKISQGADNWILLDIHIRSTPADQQIPNL